MDVDPKAFVPGATPSSLTITEAAVAALWCEALQMTEPPGATADFFDLGGDSMTMIMLEFRIREEFAIELPVDAILGTRTLRRLSTLIDEKLQARRTTTSPSSEATAT